MDLVSGLKSELFRPLVTLVVPGAIAVSPYALVAQDRLPAVGAFWSAHPAAFVAVFITAVLAAGLILEDIGARIELSLWDRLLKRKHFPTLETDWHRYLSLRTQDEVIGQRYLRTVLTRMKFELSTAPALTIHAIGLIWANAHLQFLSHGKMVGTSLGLLVVIVYLLWESYSSAYTLAEVRVDVIAAVSQTAPPMEADAG